MTFVTHLNNENFEQVVQNNSIVLVDVFATWCNPCKQLSPIIDQISTEYEGQVTVGKIDADESRATIVDLGVRNIPTLILYKNGEIVDRTAGLVSKEKISEMINTHL